MPVFASLVSIAEVRLGGVRAHCQTWNRLFISYVSIVDLMIPGVGAHCLTVNSLSYQSYLNCGARAPRGWFEFPDGECAFL